MKWRIVVLAAVCLSGNVLRAQLQLTSADLATIEASAATPADELPPIGMFYSAANPGLPAAPGDIFGLPCWSLGDGYYLVDDIDGISSAGTRAMDDSGPPFPGGGVGGDGGGYDFTNNYRIPTNGLWLQNLNDSPTNISLRLHGTISGDNYQLLSDTNLTGANWMPGEIIFDAPGGHADYSPIPMTNGVAFFNAHQASAVVAIEPLQDAIEPYPATNDPGQTGVFIVYNDGTATSDVPVYYAVSGTARNGIDYSNLTGVVTIPAAVGWAEIDVEPIADGLKPDQTVTLTLTQNPNYLIEPLDGSATIVLYANPEDFPTAIGTNEVFCPNNTGDFFVAGYDANNLPLTYFVQTWPAHGTLAYGNYPGEFLYTPFQCYEGTDSFTFVVSNGIYASPPATVSMTISDPVYPNTPPIQICRGVTSQGFQLGGSDNCGEQLTCVLLSNPSNGYLSGTPPNLTYTPGSTNFTGTDSFNYLVSSECGDSATGTVNITVGDPNVLAKAQAPMTGTNRSLNITLSGQSPAGCADPLGFAIVNGPLHGTLTGSGASRFYAPSLNFEGIDTFTFKVNDGVWTSPPATVTSYVVAGPTNLTAQCRFNQVVLNWGLDSVVRAMETEGLSILNFNLYRSTTQGGPYTVLTTNLTYFQSNYVDVAVSDEIVYYYVVTFQYRDPTTGVIYESPYSGEASVGPCSPPPPLLPGFDQNTLAPNDDDCYLVDGDDGNYLTNLLATVGFPVDFFGTTYTDLWVNCNGNVTFSNLVSAYKPNQTLLQEVQTHQPPVGGIIAPFWADVDTRGTLSGLVTYGTNTVNGNAAFAVNWIDVGYYREEDDKLDAFQMVLINRPDRAPGDYDLEFNYAQIQWETGDSPSGGNDGLGGYSARVGFASGNGWLYELPGSGIPGSFLDTNLVTGLINGSYDSDALGRYVYQFHGGTNILAQP